LKDCWDFPDAGGAKGVLLANVHEVTRNETTKATWGGGLRSSEGGRRRGTLEKKKAKAVVVVQRFLVSQSDQKTSKGLSAKQGRRNGRRTCAKGGEKGQRNTRITNTASKWESQSTQETTKKGEEGLEGK